MRAPARAHRVGAGWGVCASGCLCVSVSLGLRGVVVSFSEMQWVALKRPDPRCHSRCWPHWLGVCVSVLWRRETNALEFALERLFLAERPGDSRSGRCQSSRDYSKGSQTSTTRNQGDLGLQIHAAGGSSGAQPGRAFFRPTGDTLVHVGMLLSSLYVCTCTHNYPTNRTPLLPHWCALG